jgi:hypothetical protein
MASIAQHFIALPCGIMFMLKTTHQNQNPFTNKKAKETGHPYDICHSGIQQNLINTLLRSPVFLVF